MEEPEKDSNTATGADISPLRVTAIQVHEIFNELKSSGFAHQDAIKIVGFMLSSGVMFNPNSSFGYSDLDIIESDSEEFLDDEENYSEDDGDYLN
jgi:hypothetical protein